MLVFHVSDIHIRSGGRERCRADEYEAVIRGLVDACAEAFESGTGDGDDACPDRLVVVTGDVFHDKGSVGKAGIELFFALMRGLARHARVAVIRGNHDFVQERFAPGDPCCDTGDIIDALLSEAPIEGVAYLRSTGLHELPPFGLGVLAVQDCCSRGGTAAQDLPLPALPRPDSFSDRVSHKIALFHGMVPGGAATARWLDGYSAGLFGDVHERGAWSGPDGRIIPTSAGAAASASWAPGCCAWGYSGSLVQQNHGESPFGHGALLWDLEARTVSAVDIRSPHAFLTLWRRHWAAAAISPEDGDGEQVHDYDDPASDPECVGWMLRAGVAPSPACSVPLVAARESLPARASVRIYAPVEYQGSPEGDAARVLAALGCAAGKVSIAHGLEPPPPPCPAGGRRNTPYPAPSPAPDLRRGQLEQTGLLSGVHSPARWAEHVAAGEHAESLADMPVMDWLNGAGLAVVAPPVAHKSWGLSAAKLDERNDKVRKAAEKAAAAIGGSSAAVGGSPAAIPAANRLLTLVRLSWRWLLCYGAGSCFDFRRASGSVVMITGPNASGKSSFLEVVALALFGEPPPTRHSKDHSSSCINWRGGPSNGPAGTAGVPSTELIFRIGGVEYSLRREFARKKGNSDKLGTCSAWLSRLGGGNSGGASGSNWGSGSGSGSNWGRGKAYGAEEVRSGRTAVDRWVAENVGDIGAFLLSSMVSQDRDSDFFSMSPAAQRDVVDSALNAEGMSLCAEAIDESRRAHKWAADSIETAALSREQALPRGTRAQFVESGRAVGEARRRTACAVARLWAAATLTVSADRRVQESRRRVEENRRRLEDTHRRREEDRRRREESRRRRESEAERRREDEAHRMRGVEALRRLEMELLRASERRSSPRVEPPEPTASKPDASAEELGAALSEAEAALGASEAALADACDGQPDAVPLEAGRVETRHFETVPESSSAELAKKAAKHAARVARMEDLARRLALADALIARGPFARGCPACDQRLALAQGRLSAGAAPDDESEVEAMRGELADLRRLRPNERREHYEALSAQARAWEAADAGWRDIRAARLERIEHVSRIAHLSARVAEAKSDVGRLAGLLDARRAWDDWEAQGLPAGSAAASAEAAEGAAAAEEAEKAAAEAAGKEAEAARAARAARAAANAAAEQEAAANAAQEAAEAAEDARAEHAAAEDATAAEAAQRALSRSLAMRARAMAAAADARAESRRACAQRASAVDRRVSRRASVEEIGAMREAARRLRLREEALRRVSESLAEYGERTYRQSVSAALQRGVASVLRCMGARGFALRVDWTQKGFRFLTEAAGGAPLPLEKASGYQRASLGLAMRIALSRIGASSLSCSQLFLDEAFGSFDEANRADVGDFLRGLLASYDSVVLVSHVLPTDARDETVSIERSATGDSLLVYE